MVELKTLKDLIKTEYVDDDFYFQNIDDNLLRKEAIKWLKETILEREKEPYMSEHAVMFTGQIAFIKHFFNITEEDLQ